MYETSVQSLRSDEDEQRASPVKPFYLESQTPTERSPSRTDDRILESSEPNKTKSKWEIRLPELLSSMVGPDRQVRMKNSQNKFC